MITRSQTFLIKVAVVLSEKGVQLDAFRTWGCKGAACQHMLAETMQEHGFSHCKGSLSHSSMSWGQTAWSEDMETMLQRLYFWTPPLRATKISQSSVLKCLMHTFLLYTPFQDHLSGPIKKCTLAIGILGSWSESPSFILVLVCSFLSHLRMSLHEPQPRPISICVWIFK